MLQKGALIALNHFTGKDFTENDFGYKMEGGNSYEPTEFSTLSNIQSFLKNATEKQLSQAKELFSSLRKFGL